MALIDKLIEFQARADAMPYERAELIREMRANDPPYPWLRIAEVLHMTPHGAIKASKIERPK